MSQNDRSMTGYLEALAARVEAATGPDRELDAAVVRAIHPGAVIEPYCAGDDEPVVFHAAPLVNNKAELPAYTASIDDAMTVVPEGWHVSYASEDRHSRSWGWTLRGGYGVERTGRAATPALALLAAALCAIPANQEQIQ